MKNLSFKKSIYVSFFILATLMRFSQTLVAQVPLPLGQCMDIYNTIYGGPIIRCCVDTEMSWSGTQWDTICKEIRVGGFNGERVSFGNTPLDRAMEITPEEQVGLVSSTNTTTIDDILGSLRVGYNPFPQTDKARVLVSGFTNSINPVTYIKNNYIGATKTVVGLKIYSRPTAGSGYGLQIDAGKIGFNVVNAAGPNAGSTHGGYIVTTGSAGDRTGLYLSATGAGSGNRTGLFSLASGGAANYAGYFQGNVAINGIMVNPSDKKLKEDIHYNIRVLDKVRQLKPAEYKFKSEYVDKMNLPVTLQHGLIADEIEKIFPEMVTENVQMARYDENDILIADEIKYKGINYLGLIPVLISAINEQQDQIEVLKSDKNISKSENDQLRNQVQTLNNRLNQVELFMEQCCSKFTGKDEENINGNLKLNEPKQEFKDFLEQNSPNPFSTSTEINYSINKETATSLINVTDSKNSLVKSFTVTNSKHGKLTIPAGFLKPGVYVYELVVNGIKVDSKSMIVLP